ncbi:MAG TPA: TolC family protein, partial [Armatimonadetes bacterium]|nr:TolC family protein [Armatimonadota bacterium]
MHIMGHDATVSLQVHWLKCIVIIILNTIIHTSATQATQNAMDEILTLVRSIQIALEQNPQLRASNAQVKAARNQLRRARAQFYPRVDFTASFRQQGPEVSFTVP